MNIVQNHLFLGFAAKQSKKTGNEYLLVSTMLMGDGGLPQVFEWYVSRESLALVTAVGQCQPMQTVKVGLELKSRNNKAEVDLVHLEAVKK